MFCANKETVLYKIISMRKIRATEFPRFVNLLETLSCGQTA